MIQNILVATEGSETAGRAVEVAAELAKATGAKLGILTVESEANLPPEELKRLAQVEDDIGAMLDVQSNEVLGDAEKRARSIGAPSVRTEARWGDAAEGILEAARDQGADGIVVGRRGHGRLAGLLVGSVSQKVVSLAPCTVIVVS